MREPAARPAALLTVCRDSCASAALASITSDPDAHATPSLVGSDVQLDVARSPFCQTLRWQAILLPEQPVALSVRTVHFMCSTCLGLKAWPCVVLLLHLRLLSREGLHEGSYAGLCVFAGVHAGVLSY
jgi:hypothetical protein